jgi:hypothetical protein
MSCHYVATHCLLMLQNCWISFRKLLSVHIVLELIQNSPINAAISLGSAGLLLATLNSHENAASNSTEVTSAYASSYGLIK